MSKTKRKMKSGTERMLSLQEPLMANGSSTPFRSPSGVDLVLVSPGVAKDAPALKRIFSALFFALASTSTMFVNKIVLTNYRFPSFLVLGIGQMVAIVAVLFMANGMGVVKLPRFTRATCSKIFPLPFLYIMNLVSGLGGTKKLNLPMFTVLRRFSILMTMIAEYFVLGVRPRPAVQLAVALMITGSIVAATDDLTFDAPGYLMIFMNDFATAANGVCLKRKLEAKDLGKNGLQFYNALLMLPFALAIAFVTGDLQRAYEYQGWFDAWFLTCFSLACLCGFVLNYAIVLCTHYNSALVTACVGTMKNLFVTYGGMLISGDYLFSLTNFIGINISVFGSIIYTLVTFTFGRPSY